MNKQTLTEAVRDLQQAFGDFWRQVISALRIVEILQFMARCLERLTKRS